jgi:hypothetical protein
MLSLIASVAFSEGILFSQMVKNTLLAEIWLPIHCTVFVLLFVLSLLEYRMHAFASRF